MLGALGLHGGPTATIPLLIGSPAIAAGLPLPGGASTDQRGLPRLVDRGSGVPTEDIGAFEVQDYVVTTTLDDPAAPTGSMTLRDAVNAASAARQRVRQIRAGPLRDMVDFGIVGDTTVGPTALAITGSVEIDGPVLADGGLTLSPAAGQTMRLFYVAPGAGLTLQDLTLERGRGAGLRRRERRRGRRRSGRAGRRDLQPRRA